MVVGKYWTKKRLKSCLAVVLILSVIAALGLRNRNLPAVMTVTAAEQEELYTYLSFHDYRTLQGEELPASVVSEVTQIQTKRVENLDKVIFSGEIAFGKLGADRDHTNTIRIGGCYSGIDYSWHGIELYTTDGTTLMAYNVYTNEYTYVGTFTEGQPVKISLQFDKIKAGTWSVGYTVNEQFCKKVEYKQEQDFGNSALLCPRNESSISFTSTEGKNPIKEMSPVSYDLDDGSYLVTGEVTDAAGKKVAVNADNPVLTVPGDYVVLRREGSFQYSQKVALYRMGDIDLNGTPGEISDLEALRKMLKGKSVDYAGECASDYAADLDNDEKVGQNDLKLMEDILNENSSTTLEGVLKKYHVPALTYDYLGGDEVMPIVGFYGPYRNVYDYINEDIFKLVKESGINLINYSRNAIGETTYSALQLLELAEKYGIGYYVDDWNLNPEFDMEARQNGTAATNIPIGSSGAPTTADIAAWIGKYDYYESYLGTHVKDEPFENIYDMTDELYNAQLQFYDWSAYTLNQFANNHGFINLLSPDLYNDFNEFCDAYVEAVDAKCLSYDTYPFAYGGSIYDMGAYYSLLWQVRNKAQEHNIPFWAYVEAGGDFRDAHLGTALDAPTNEELLPTEAETYWNVNNYLAFGAKGIEWFTLIQPYYYSHTENGNDFDRSGLIGADGTPTPFYTYAQNMNKQIAAVDEVLMKSTSTGIMATGTTTKNMLQAGGVTLQESTAILKNVASENQTLGAVVGCFDYGDTEAFYVVNYSVDDSQSITLSFDDTYQYRYIYDAKEYQGTGSSFSLEIGAGKGVLVVLEGKINDCIELTGSRVTLDGKLSIALYAQPKLEIAMENTYMQITLPNGTKKKILTPAEKEKYGYEFTCEIAAKEMADTITVQMFHEDGTILSTAKEYSIKVYAETIIANADAAYTDAEVALTKAMLNYGAYAQIYFEYHIDRLANAGLTKEERNISAVTAGTLAKYEIKDVPSQDSIGKLAGTSLILESETTLKFYFLLAKGCDASRLEFTIGTGDSAYKAMPVQSGSYYCVSVENIAAHQLDKEYTVTVSDGENTLCVNYSVMAYCFNVLERKVTETRTEKLQNLIKAMYLYNYAANDYLVSIEEDNTPFEPF